jgi:hypothetical protein
LESSFDSITATTLENSSQRISQHGLASSHNETHQSAANALFQPAPSSPTLVSGHLPVVIENSTGTTFAVSEEDAHVQTLHRMTNGSNPISSRSGISEELHNHEVVEYFDCFNSVSILGEALGHRQRRRLIQLDLPGPKYLSVKQRELSNLDPADVAYLNARNVFAKPPRSAWYVVTLF